MAEIERVKIIPLTVALDDAAEKTTYTQLELKAPTLSQAGSSFMRNRLRQRRSRRCACLLRWFPVRVKACCSRWIFSTSVSVRSICSVF